MALLSLRGSQPCTLCSGTRWLAGARGASLSCGAQPLVSMTELWGAELDVSEMRRCVLGL